MSKRKVKIESVKPQGVVPETKVSQAQSDPTPVKVRYRYGIKALTAYGTTENDRYGSTAYILPRPDQKWGDVMVHPNPGVPDGLDCGAGRYHVHKKITKQYAPKADWFWFTRTPAEDVLGESDEKMGVKSLQLRRIKPEQLWKLIRRGWAKNANLSCAKLYNANLENANLYNANLYNANLSCANLSCANLSCAKLYNANLENANLYNANLYNANLYNANLYNANLENANLSCAKLYNANLSYANLSYANLNGCRYNEFTRFPDNFVPDTSGMIKIGN